MGAETESRPYFVSATLNFKSQNLLSKGVKKSCLKTQMGADLSTCEKHHWRWAAQNPDLVTWWPGRLRVAPRDLVPCMLSPLALTPLGGEAFIFPFLATLPPLVICIWEVLPSLGLKLAHQHISLRPATNFLLNHQRTLDVLVASAMKLRPFTLLKN